MTILRDISIIWSLLHVLILFSFLFSSRFSRKKTTILTLLFMGPLAAINTFLYLWLGPEQMGQSLLLTCTAPSLIFFLFLAKQRDGRFFFSFCLADTVSYWIICVTAILDHYVFGNRYIFMFIVRMAAFPILEYITLKKFRQPYRDIQQLIRNNWGVFAAVSALYYILMVLMSSYPTIFYTRPSELPAFIMVLILMPLIYWNIFQVLFRQHKLFSAEEQTRLLQMQTDLLQQQAQRLHEAEESMRIYRHDLRHKLRAAAAMVEKGAHNDALKQLAYTQQELDEITVTRYCSNSVLDAMFSDYYQRAKAAGIQVDSYLSLPEELPVSAAELAAVFANALENAINACKELPEEQRWIRCKCLTIPQLMFRISNPYTGTVLFDHNGKPFTEQEGHGIGTRSISAFCEKYGAHCEYHAENNIFSLRILIME